MNASTANGEPMTESLSIVIPVYRSAAILPELYARLVDALHKLGGPYEIIFVEDCGGEAPGRRSRTSRAAILECAASG